MVDGGENSVLSAKRKGERRRWFFFFSRVKRGFSLNRFKFHASAVFLLADILMVTVKYRCLGRHSLLILALRAEQPNKNVRIPLKPVSVRSAKQDLDIHLLY